MNDKLKDEVEDLREDPKSYLKNREVKLKMWQFIATFVAGFVLGALLF